MSQFGHGMMHIHSLISNRMNYRYIPNDAIVPFVLARFVAVSAYIHYIYITSLAHVHTLQLSVHAASITLFGFDPPAARSDIPTYIHNATSVCARSAAAPRL